MPQKRIRKFLSILLVTALLSLPAQALTPKSTMFDDVPADEWYSVEVAICANAGIMVGTGQGQFSPDKVLTQNECTLLALRLHELMNGGDGVLEKAPEDWGKLTLTLADGTVLTSYGTQLAPLPGMEGTSFAFDWWTWGMMGHVSASNLQATLLPNETMYDISDRAAWELLGQWGDAREGPATVTVGDVTVPGTVNCWFPVGPWVLAFHPDDDSQETEALLKSYLYASRRDAWWRDADYYRSQNGLDLTFLSGELPATRAYFSKCLALAAGELPPLRQVEAIPDVDRETNPEIYALYEAGILTGVDKEGTFAGESTLTRAEAAAMAARVLEPDLRITESSPASPPTDGYTLTYLMAGESNCGVSYPVVVMEDGILTLDGAFLDWPEGTGEGVPSSGLEQRGDYVYMMPWDRSNGDYWGHAAGLMDGDGSMAIPFGLYDDVWPTGDGHFIGKKTDDADWSRCFLLSADGKVEAELSGYFEDGAATNDWRYFNEGVCPWLDQESQLWGYVDAQGSWVVEPAFFFAQGFQSGYAVVWERADRMGLMDHSGSMVIPFGDYEGLFPFENSPGYEGPEGLIGFTGPEGFGWMDLDGSRYPAGGVDGAYRPFCNGYFSYEGIYYDVSLKPVSQRFDWAGQIGPDGRGFVGLDGKIYRIQFLSK